MKWYWTVAGGHTHVRVFMNGAKCGDLCFRNEEFNHIRRTCTESICNLSRPPDGLLIDFLPDEVREHYPLSQVECRP